jgi:hypothetical protein
MRATFSRAEIVELEDEAHAVAAELGERAFAAAAQVPAFVAQRSRRGHVESPEDVQQGRFAAAGGAEQHHELAAVEVEIHALERHDIQLAGLIDFPHAAGLKDRRGISRGGKGGLHSRSCL